MKLINLIFGCRHYETTRVFARKVDGRQLTYQVCLTCGRELPYDLVNMKRVA